MPLEKKMLQNGNEEYEPEVAVLVTNKVTVITWAVSSAGGERQQFLAMRVENDKF